MLALTFSAVLIASGCLCCSPPSSGKKATTTRAQTTMQVVCNAPYIRLGSGCCLDVNSNRICDSDETTAPTAASTLQSQSLETVRTTTAQTMVATTAMTTTTTTRPASHQAKCVAKYGLNADTVVYLYTHECCDSTVTPMVASAAAEGYRFERINLESPSPREESIILCFYASMPQFVPEFLCPANGDSMLLTGYGSPQSRITAFAKECLNAV